MKKNRNKEETALVAKATDEVMQSDDLNTAVKECIKTGDETSLLTWTYNSTQVASFEYTLAIEEVLRSMLREDMGLNKKKPTQHEENEFDRRFEKYIDRFHENMRDFLLSLGQVHGYGSHPMTPQDMEVVGKIAQAKYPHEKRQVLMQKLGVALPSPVDPLGAKELLEGNE